MKANDQISNTKKHILVVDDDVRIRDLLQAFLHRSGFGVTTAQHAEHAACLLSALSFDIIILDVMMPGENGFQFAKRLRKTMHVPILFLTAKGEVADRVSGFETGGDDYLVKPFEPKELLLRISAILRRGVYVQGNTPHRLLFGQTFFDTETNQLQCGQKVIPLTATEIHLMRILSMPPFKTVERREISRLLGRSYSSAQRLDDRTIDMQIMRLRRKIEHNPKKPCYLQTVRGVGYMLLPEHYSQ